MFSQKGLLLAHDAHFGIHDIRWARSMEVGMRIIGVQITESRNLPGNPVKFGEVNGSSILRKNILSI